MSRVNQLSYSDKFRIEIILKLPPPDIEPTPFWTSRDTLRTGKIAAAKQQLQPTFYFLI